jgi:hypothetical protein
MEKFNLFIKTLISYHNKCIKEDLPINVINPLLITIDFLLGGELHYEEVDVEKRLIAVCEKIYLVHKNSELSEDFLMYSIVTLINQKHDFFITYKNDIIKASDKTSKIEYQRNDDVYWLSAWHPGRVAENGDLFIEKIKYSKEMWKEESKELERALFGIIFQPIFDNTAWWDLLKCEGDGIKFFSKNSHRLGLQKKYYQNGKLMEVGEYTNESYIPHDFWDENGNQLLKNGTGKRTVKYGYLESDIYEEYYEDGKFVKEVRV